jgi:hypothetical protein
MEAMMTRITDAWCSLMHESPMWPIHGHYQCRTCGREYPVLWESDSAPEANPRLRTLRLADASK